MSVKPIPDGYHSVTPYLTVDRAREALAFYQRAFSAIVLMQMQDADGAIRHAEIKIGDSIIMLSDEAPELGALSPRTLGGRSSALLLYVADVDGFVATAVAAGAILRRAVADQFYGDRTASIEDPFGQHWHVATHIEDVSPEEMQRRMQALGG
ncbi:VOC family protein [Chitinimonas sp.]|uniref:VOC family protein n=1 Tax=Chitinimonas sp. TaxID=1934313 RepID=UPI0035AF39B2